MLREQRINQYSTSVSMVMKTDTVPLIQQLQRLAARHGEHFRTKTHSYTCSGEGWRAPLFEAASTQASPQGESKQTQDSCSVGELA